MINNKPSRSHENEQKNHHHHGRGRIVICSSRRFRKKHNLTTTTRFVILSLVATAILISLDDSCLVPVIAFTIAPNRAAHSSRAIAATATTTRTTTTITTLFSSSTPSTPELPNISDMKSGEIRSELESYGISTKAFLEKKEMVAALEKARAEGKKPINGSNNEKKKTTSSSSASSSSSKSTSSSSSSSSSSKDGDSDGKNRADRIKEEMEKAKSMKVGELKKELQSRGISTKSFFEKTEFVKAYAEAIVDNVSSKKEEEEPPLDPDYRDVTMQKMPRGDPRLLQGTVIDIIAA